MTASVTKQGNRASAICLSGDVGGRLKAPRVVLAETALNDTIAEQLRRFGFDVRTATTSDEAVMLALEANPTAVVLPTETHDSESGYLVCAKLRRARPRLKLVLVGSQRTPADERLARFVGATLVTGASEVVNLLI